MIEFVFSFILSTWSGFGEVQVWADEHLGGAQVLTAPIVQEEQILCSLERQGLLVYDGQWKKKAAFSTSPECLRENATLRWPASLDEIEVRSETLGSVPKNSSWDQRVDVKIPGKGSFSLYIRQDKKHVGVHSTNGWSMWVERKTGHIRYEMIDKNTDSHFRLKAQGHINPLKGVLTDVKNVEALHVHEGANKVLKAYMLVARGKEGVAHVAYVRDQQGLKKRRCGAKGGKALKNDELSDFAEQELTQFAKVSSKPYQDFILQGQPLAFDRVNPERLVPETAIFR